MFSWLVMHHVLSIYLYIYIHFHHYILYHCTLSWVWILKCQMICNAIEQRYFLLYSLSFIYYLNTLRPRQNEQLFADDIFKCIFFNENVIISIKISLKFIPKCSINNIPSLVQIMAWCLPGDKPLSEPMMVRLLTHICVTRPQWVKSSWPVYVTSDCLVHVQTLLTCCSLSQSISGDLQTCLLSSELVLFLVISNDVYGQDFWSVHCA